MNEGLSAGDILALTRDNDGMGNAWNNPFIYLVWLALLGGGGLFGNRRDDGALQGALTRSDLFEGFNNQDVNSQLRGITNGLCDGFYAINSGLKDNQGSMKDGFYGIQGALAENRFAQQECCCATNRNIDSVRSEAYRNTCEITTAIHAEGEATRALINANTMQDLRDKLADRDRDLQTANFQLSQQAQNATLIGALRPFPQPAYITAGSPYQSVNVGYNPYGCCHSCNS